MERRTYQKAQRRELLLSILRFIFLMALIAGSYFLVRYIRLKSDQEIAAVVDREDSPYYLVVEQPVRMTVVDDKGEMSMEITGEKVYLTTDHKTAIFEGADAKYYEDGEVSITMHADKIEYDMDSEDFELTGNLEVETKDGMYVAAEQLIWRRFKAVSGRMAKVPAFSFPQGVHVINRNANGQKQFEVSADYLQADKEIQYMEFVGHVHGEIVGMNDTGFISDRELTDEGQLNFEDFEKLGFEAEQLIFDNKNQVVLATSRYYDRRFVVMDPDGQIVDVAAYQEEEQPVTFSKEEITIQCYHLEAKIKQKWAACVGEIRMEIPPAEPEAGDDRALKSVKQFATYIATGEMEYFWGRDHVITHSPTRVEQEDRLALADRIVYWGVRKQVLLDGHISVVQGDGKWLVEEELISVEDHDMERAVTSYSELTADRAVIYLDNNDFVASGNVLARQDDRETAADTIVYQDEIKRISAQGNVKFRDKDGQQLVCGGLVFHNEYDFMEVSGGASATLLLPAKFANDINQTLAEVRETEAPPEITDPPVSEGGPARNPNINSTIRGGLQPIQVSHNGEPLRPVDGEAGVTPLSIPGQGEAGTTTETGAQELILQLGDDTTLEVLEEGFIPDETEPEPEPEPEPEAEEGEGQ